MTRTLPLAIALGAVIVPAPWRGAAHSPSEIHALLRQVGFTAADLTAVERGRPVARVVETERTEVAVAGAVRVRAPRARVLDRYRDVSLLARSDMVLQVGRFDAAPAPEDLRPLEFEQYDLQSLRQCVPGECAVRLPASALPRLQSRVNRPAPDWREHAAAAWREVLAEYAADYLARGASALAEYRNKQQPLRLEEQFDILFRAASPVRPFAPEFLRYLQEFPRDRPPGVEDILYWSKDDFGLRPVVSITHLSIHAPHHAHRAAVVATKQIYATHYFDGALGLTLVFDDGDGGTYVAALNRARTRSLTGRLRGFVRGTVQGRAREGLEKVLRGTKDALDRPK